MDNSPDFRHCCPLTWLLAETPQRRNTAKGVSTLVELVDPQRLKRSLVVWLDGEPGDILSAARPRTPIALHVETVYSGKAHGELVGVASRESVEAAFTRAVEKR